MMQGSRIDGTRSGSDSTPGARRYAGLHIPLPNSSYPDNVVNALLAKQPHRHRICLAAAIVFVVSLLLLTAVTIVAQPPKVYRIGYLSYLGCSEDPFLPGGPF